ncbi:MAG: FkbM family methyltransferase [Planctomycetes bacterium]|nr:FkbM family methyltransferase [Planctomycetota bacterium]
MLNNIHRFRRALGRVHRSTTAAIMRQPAAPGVIPDDVLRVYEMLLGRPPESLTVVNQYVKAQVSLPYLIYEVSQSQEFVGRWQNRQLHQPAHGTPFEAFPAHTGPGKAGFITDFLGTRTRTAFIRGTEHLSGHVEGYPIPGNFHGSTIEWAGVLNAVLEAKDQMVAVELGAGWAPWLVTVAVAATRLGIANFQLVGVEGSAAHFAFMRQHFLDNGLNPDTYTLLHGVAAGADGMMEFPELADPAGDYGGTVAAETPFMPRVSAENSQVPAYSLPTLLAPFDKVDLVHIDIQGSELDVVGASQEVLRQKVRRLVIGTHGRVIEQKLAEMLSQTGWNLELDEACKYRAQGRSIVMWADGCQVWRNLEV